MVDTTTVGMKTIILLWLIVTSLPSFAGQAEYTFGVVPQYEQRRLFQTWKPIIAEIERRAGITLRLTGSPQIPSFEERFQHGDFDFAYMNPYHVLRAYQSQGYIPLVRDGASPIRGILVVRRDSRYQHVSDLEGATIAFPSPNALGASLMLRADLSRRFNVRIKPLYVQTHSSVYLQVASGLSPAGGGIDQTLRLQPTEVRNQLRVIHTTLPIIGHPIVAHRRVPSDVRTRVRQAILDIGKSPRGRALLAGIPMAQPVSTRLKDYQPLLTMGLDEFASLTGEPQATSP